jgi:crotonobetainyl-CoA:carnitine CoA-transferase CaiB-like acyl-CoA transferase
MSEQPMGGVKVLDLTRFIAGPYCTKTLADYGAEVIKVEKPIEGDPARSMEPFLGDSPHLDKSLLFSHLNLNKKGITLNLKSETGIEILKELVAETDILVESFSPGTMAGLGLDYDFLKRINPRMVMTSISNYGQTGPYRDYKLSELILNGFHSQINVGLPDRYPLKKGGYACLYQSGLMACLATLGALLALEDQDVGQYLDISIMETQAGDVDRKTIDLLSWEYSGRTVYDQRPRGPDNGAAHIMPAGIYPCKEGYVSSTPILPHWPRFVELMKNPELEKIKFPDDMFDMDIKGEIDVMWYEWLSERTAREAMVEAQAVKFFVTALSTPKDAVEDPQFVDRGFWVEADHPVSGKQTYPGAPVRIGEDGWRIRRPAPVLGQHNHEVLSGLGYSETEIDQFKNTGII